MDKINEELQNLRSRHDQLLSQIDESQNQDTVMELKFLIEEKISAIQLLITPNPKQQCAKIYPENALHYINEFPVVFIFTQKNETFNRASVELWCIVGERSSAKYGAHLFHPPEH